MDPEVPANSELYCFASSALGLTLNQANATAAWLRPAFNTYRCLVGASEPLMVQARNRLSRLYQPFDSSLLFLSSQVLLLLAFVAPSSPAPVYSSQHAKILASTRLNGNTKQSLFLFYFFVSLQLASLVSPP